MHCVLVALFFSSSVFMQSVSEKTDQKRILLNDPNYVQQQFNHLQSEIQRLQVQLNSQQGGKAVTFVRWGRKDCPSNTSELVYSGFVGGAWFDTAGSAVDFLCLPSVPTWGIHKNVHDEAEVSLFGTEYQKSFVFGMDTYNEDVPCAVCLSSQHSTSLMIPASTQCSPGWTKAYGGNLGAGFQDKSGSRYICVDQNPEAVNSGDPGDENGKVVVSVKVRCGSLKCPPYEDNKTLACVVCLK